MLKSKTYTMMIADNEGIICILHFSNKFLLSIKTSFLLVVFYLQVFGKSRVVYDFQYMTLVGF